MDNELNKCLFLMDVIAPLMMDLTPVGFRTIICSLFDAYEDSHPEYGAVDSSKLVSELVREAHETNYGMDTAC